MKKMIMKKVFNALFYLLYPCESRSYTQTEEVRLRGFENRLLRGVFGPKREEVTDRMLENIAYERIHKFYCLRNIITLIIGRQLNERSVKRTWKKREVTQHAGR